MAECERYLNTNVRNSSRAASANSLNSTKAYGQAMMSSEPNFQDLEDLYGMIHRMQAVSLQRTVERAEKVVQELYCGEHAVFEFLFGFNTDVAEHRAREFGEEAFDEVTARVRRAPRLRFAIVRSRAASPSPCG
jgi:hypothetical protein